MKLTYTLYTLAAVLLLVVMQAAPAQSLSSQPQAYAVMARTPLAATL